MIDALINISCTHSRVPDDGLSYAGMKYINYKTIIADNHTLFQKKKTTAILPWISFKRQRKIKRAENLILNELIFFQANRLYVSGGDLA